MKLLSRTCQTRLSKTFANLPNTQKQYEPVKTSFWLWLSIVWETRKFTRYERKEFSYITFLYKTNQKRLSVQLARADVHSQREIKENFDPEKLTVSINSEN